MPRRVKGKSNRWEQPPYRWANGVPLPDRDAALQINGCERIVTDAEGKRRPRSAFITDWPITADNTVGLGAAGRARWQIENESNHGLKHRGHHLEHSFGHGQHPLSSLLVTMNLPAFGLHTLRELADADCRQIRATLGARRQFVQHLEALTSHLHSESWRKLMELRLRGLEIGPYAAQRGGTRPRPTKARRPAARAAHCPQRSQSPKHPRRLPPPLRPPRRLAPAPPVAAQSELLRMSQDALEWAGRPG